MTQSNKDNVSTEYQGKTYIDPETTEIIIRNHAALKLLISDEKHKDSFKKFDKS